MANKSVKSDQKVKKEIPKIPALGFGFKKQSIFSADKGFVPKMRPEAKFNQATFHTQHKGGTSGGK
jgi:hypothetical protein